MAKKNDDNGKGPDFWRGYVWGFIWTPLIISGVTLVGATIVGVAAAVVGRPAPGADWLRRQTGDIPPPGPEPIDVEEVR